MASLNYLTDGTLELSGFEYQDAAGAWQPILGATVTADIVDAAGSVIVAALTLAQVGATNTYRSAVLYDAGLVASGTYRARVTANGGAGLHWYGELEFTILVDT